MSEKYISPAEREYIAKAWRNYASVAEIATHLGKSRKTIFAELRRGQDVKSWTGTSAPPMTRNWRSAVSRLTSDAEASPSRRAPDTEELKRRYNAMGKRKEIKFLCKDGQTREGRQDGVMFWIRKDQKREQDGLPCYYVAANDTKGKGRTVFTGDHEYFTLEDAKELCQQIMAGEANLAERKARYAAEDMEKERRAVAAATEQAKAFRDKLEATGISYHELLALEQAHEDLGNMAHNILLGW